jgi:uncharacterized membrane protein YqjE
MILLIEVIWVVWDKNLFNNKINIKIMYLIIYIIILKTYNRFLIVSYKTYWLKYIVIK